MIATQLDLLFLACVTLIWFMIIYQLVLCIAGYFHFRASLKEQQQIDSTEFDYPLVTLLIPAHNEGKVIARTVEALLALDYPRDKLEVLVINDCSTDDTGTILDKMASQDPRLRILHRGPGEGGRGKSSALNAARQIARGSLIGIYDADNRPEPAALKYLVAQLLLHPELGAAIGKFRTQNRHRNLLTRFINIEGLTFQWIVQAGRWKLMQVATIPGTNCVIRKSLLDTIGGWDEEALTEDSELSIRIYQEGFRIKFVPYAVTWEQEPETFRVWLKQRTRWVRGNNYVIGKFAHIILKFKSKRLALELLYVLSLYYLFLAAIVISDLFFLLGLFGVISISVYGPYTQVWLLAFALFAMEMLVALSYDREDTLSNFLISLLMYFTYCQAWLLVVFRGLYQDFITREKRVWDKTERFE